MMEQDLQRKLKLKEGIIIALILAAAVLSAFLTNTSQNGSTAVIKADGVILKELPLNTDTIYKAEDYDMEFTVSDGRICVSHAGCHDRVCMNTGFISGSYQSIVCLPNRITVTITGGADEDIDIVL